MEIKRKPGQQYLYQTKQTLKQRDKEGHYIMIKGSIQEEGITNALNIETHKYIKQMLTDVKGEINSNTIIVGDFNTPLTSRDSFSRHKINKETQALNDKIDQIQLIDIYLLRYTCSEIFY